MVLEERLAVRLTVSDNKGIDQLFRGEHPDLRDGDTWWKAVQDKLYKTDIEPNKVCIHCGKAFYSLNPNRLLCSTSCRNERQAIRVAENWYAKKKEYLERYKAKKNK